jgi:hypothetical protein
MSNTTVAVKKNCTINNLFKLKQSITDTMPFQIIQNKIIGHHAKVCRGACQI